MSNITSKFSNVLIVQMIGMCSRIRKACSRVLGLSPCRVLEPSTSGSLSPHY